MSIISVIYRYFDEPQTKRLSKRLGFDRSHKKVSMKSIKSKTAREIEKEQWNVVVNRSGLHRLITFAEHELRPVKYIDFLVDLGKVCINEGHLNLADDILKSVQNRAKDIPREKSKSAYALINLSDVASRRAHWKEALSSIRKAETIFTELGDFRGLASCRNLTGTVFADTGELKKAARAFNEGLAFLDKKKDPFTKAKIETNIGTIYNIFGKFDEAYSNYNRALIKFEQLGFHSNIAEVFHNIGMLLLKKRKLKEALNQFDRSLSVSLSARIYYLIAISYLSKAETYTIIPDLALADAYTEKSLELGYKLDDKLTIADAFKVKGSIMRLQGNHESALELLLTSLRLNEKIKSKMNYAETCVELGLLYKSSNDVNLSTEYVHKALHIFRKIGAKPELKFIKENFTFL